MMMIMMLMMTMKSDYVDAGKTSLMTAVTTMDGGYDDDKVIEDDCGDGNNDGGKDPDGR